MEVPGAEHASKLQVPHNLFHGVSIALCDASEVPLDDQAATR